jgi:hypothetical protein
VEDVTMQSFDDFIELLTEVWIIFLFIRYLLTFITFQRNEKRRGWKQRESDPFFKTIPANEKPLSCPLSELFNLWKEFDFYGNSRNEVAKGNDNNDEDTIQMLMMDKVLNYLRELKSKFVSKKP